MGPSHDLGSLCPPAPAWKRHWENFGIARSVRLSVPWRSCLGYRHAGCLQLSHRRPPEMCGLRTRPRTDVDPPRFLDQTVIGGEGDIVSPPPGRYLVNITTDTERSSALQVLDDYALYKSTQSLTCSLCVQVLVRRVGVANVGRLMTEPVVNMKSSVFRCSRPSH